MIRRRLPMTFVAVAVLAAGMGAASAQVDPTSPAIYRLDTDTGYQSGCFPPCECPLVQGAMRGTFVLTPAGADPLFQHFNVTDVNWTVALGNPELRITGSGTYRIGGEVALQQQLELDLTVGNQPVQHFDSGLVTGPAPFPKIHISVSLHGQYCIDTVLLVSASPVPAEQIRPYRLTRQSTFQRGCSGPCACAPGAMEPITGTFALVELQRNPLFTEYAVASVRWTVNARTPPTHTVIPVLGFGTYRVGGEVAIQQQLSLDLTVGGAPRARFDSGPVSGGASFPRIDALITSGEGTCVTTRIDVHARPERHRASFDVDPGFRIEP